MSDLLALLLTDIVDSTQVNVELGDAEMAAWWGAATDFWCSSTPPAMPSASRSAITRASLHSVRRFRRASACTSGPCSCATTALTMWRAAPRPASTAWRCRWHHV